MEKKTGDKNALDLKQSASAAQFNQQSDRYGKSHILADTQDVEKGLRGVLPPPGGTALDVATGGGHTALWLARHGWKVTAGDIAPRMLENAQRLCTEVGIRIETRLLPAEEMPFADGSFDLVTVRVASHHFSSPRKADFELALTLFPFRSSERARSVRASAAGKESRGLALWRGPGAAAAPALSSEGTDPFEPALGSRSAQFDDRKDSASAPARS
jgi:SAM-dependent methyltransferase